MVTIKDSIFSFLFVIVFIFAIFGLFLHCKFLELLKEEHFEKWKELGSPTLFKNNSIKNNLAILAFLRNGEYIKMDDSQLTKISRLVWNYARFYLIFFVVTSFIFAITLIKK